MILIKPGVDIRGVGTEVSFGLHILDAILQKHGCDCMITACRDGEHMDGSKHCIGDAVDVRLASRWVTTSNVDLAVLNETRAALSDQFDFLLEADHFHLEFDPKGDTRS